MTGGGGGRGGEGCAVDEDMVLDIVLDTTHFLKLCVYQI